MGEEITFQVNDTTRAIAREMNSLQKFESPRCDGRIKAMILSKLQEAHLLSLLLVKEIKIDTPARDIPATEDVPF